jgi:hypothetical protein
MAEQRSPEEWADYYRARMAFVREQVRQGVPLNDAEGRQAILAFAQQWQDSHRTEEDPWSLAALQAKMETLTEGHQAETQTLKQHTRMGY